MPVTSGFHLHPHYRMPKPLDSLLLLTEPGQDEFVSEKRAAQIEKILGEWSASLLQSPPGLSVIEKCLDANFTAASLTPVETKTVRQGPPIEIRRNTFDHALSRTRQAFLRELLALFRAWPKILTAEFQITRVEDTPSEVRTAIRYELVAAVPNAHREQRVGYWNLTWKAVAGGAFTVLTWQTQEETQCRSTNRVYADITAAALGGNPSYSAQLQHGSDYWRTILDAACGIDIYGHNGVSLGDIDNDGLDDLYICQPGGLPNRLYRNRGDGTFEDITQASGVGVIENTACALFVDVNNDGRQDLVVVRNNGPLLFLNDGNGKFHQKANAFEFAAPPQGTFTGAAVADYDRDGWLDIYFCLYIYYQGTSQYKYPAPYHDANNGPPNFLMCNNRNGTFRDVTAESGMNQNNTRYSFCCAWNDFNGDGWPDLCVVNDFGRKNLYLNNGNGTFTDVAAEAGVEDIGAGMSGCWFDYDNDGAGDLYIANMWTAAGERITMQEQFKKSSSPAVRALYHKHAMGNSLFSSPSAPASANPSLTASDSNSSIPSGRAAAGKFADVTDVSQTRIGRWAWSSDSWDFDHDTYSDLYVTNGMVSAPDRGSEDLNSFFWRQVVAKSPDDAKPSHGYEQAWSAINELIRSDRTWSGYERNIFYANNGDGTFSDISAIAGLDFPEDSRAFAVADFDQDGRQEIFLKNRNAPQLRILKNVLPTLPPSIAFRLQGTKSNRDAIGAVIKIETANGVQTRSLQAGSGFLSQHSKEVFFGIGGSSGPVSATILWPSGHVQKLRDLPINHRILVIESEPGMEGDAPTHVVPFQTRIGLDQSARAFSLEQPPETFPGTAETWLLAPVSAPAFSLASLSGQQQSLSALRGQPVLLNFGAATDERCRQYWFAFDGHYALWSAHGWKLLAIHVENEESLRAFTRDYKLSFPILQGSDDVAAVYNIVYRHLFDRHRDLTLPTSFLIDAKGEIVKVYQGSADPLHIEKDFRNIPRTPAERMARALPFQGVTDVEEFGRNYLSYGSVFFQRGYYDEAGDAFQTALRDDPESAEAVYGIGSVLLNQGSNAEAQKYFERALKMRPTYPDTLPNSWNNLGLIAGREGRLDDAVAYFQEALRLSPDHPIALNNLGSAYRQQSQWDEARKTYQRVLALNANDADANYGLGMVYAQQDDTAHAFEHLQQALKARPDYPEALNNLGILYLRTHQRDDAVASFEQAIQVAPDFDQPYLNLARVHLVEGDKQAARTVLKRFLARKPKHPTALEMLAELGG